MSISIKTLQRLPIYLRVLKQMKQDNIETVSSTVLANELGYNAIQVRKDLALASKKDGKARVGFNVGELIVDIENLLNLNKKNKVIVVGAGKLGQALMNYDNYESNIEIVMGFARDEKKCDNKKIFHISKLKELVKRNNIKIAIITVSKQSAQDVCDLLVDAGIKGIWNFAPINLKVPEDVIVKNEDLDASLAILIRKIS